MDSVQATEEEWEEFRSLEPRIVTFDIEVDDRTEGFPELGAERVLSIVAHDSYSDETIGFIHTIPENDEKLSDDDGLMGLGLDEEFDILKCSFEEKRMLRNFGEWIRDKDPDLLTGWNVDDFDAPYVIERMEKLGLDPGMMSPLGWSGVNNYGEARIKGRTVYDLLTVYKKNSWTELRSYKLDNVAREELGEEKIHFDGTFYNLYENDPAEFLKYNARDVDLVVRINEEAGVIKFRDLLRRQVGVDFEDSFDNKDFVDMMCRRKLHEWGKIGPSRPARGEEPDSDYEGAFVFEGYKGVAENVVGLDLASLYPYTMYMLNASPETKVDGALLDDDRDGLWADVGTTMAGESVEVPVVKASNGALFHKEEKGLFPSLVDDAIGLKSHYKELRQQADTQEEREYYDEQYGVAKTITNSLYGVTGWERFFLYDEKVAEAVTLTGQAVIKATAERVEDRHNLDVLYGDTDSVYVAFPSGLDRETVLDQSMKIAERLNNETYEDLAESMGIDPQDNLWDIEVEVFMERYFQWGKKKRYAYLASWKDGHELDEPKVSVTGSASVRSDRARLTGETEKAIIREVLVGNEDAVGTIVFEAGKKIDRENPDWEAIGMPQGLGKRLDDYDTPGAHVRGAKAANEALDTNFGKDDKPMRCYIEPTTIGGRLREQTDVICYEEAEDLESAENALRADVSRMTDKLLVTPLRDILGALDIDVSAAVRGQEQTGLGAWS